MLSRIISVALCATSGNLFAQIVPVEEVWHEIRQNSPALKADVLQREAANEHSLRLGRHWYPRFYLDGRGYSTNDPAQSFIGRLEQRQLVSNDFALDELNHPSGQTFARGALGVDLALYQGGSSTAMSDSAQAMNRAAKSQLADTEVKIYTQTAQSYGVLVVTQSQLHQALELQNQIDRTLKSYKLGSKSNPVGHSGLLGLRSARNRVEGLIRQIQTTNKSHFILLREMGFARQDWQPRPNQLPQYIEQSFHVGASESARLGAARAQADAALSAVQAENARLRPQIGIFAEETLFHGDRATASGYSAGLYLQWNIWNGVDSGAGRESQLRAEAAAQRVSALRSQERAQIQSLDEARSTLKENFRLLDASQQMLAEQAQVSGELFRSGALNALQMAEIYSRQADVLNQELELALQWLEKSAQLMIVSGAHPQDILNSQTDSQKGATK